MNDELRYVKEYNVYVNCDGTIVRNTPTSDNRKIHLNRKGYCECAINQLTEAGNPKSARVHRLVALAWVDGYFEGAQVDHIDGNRQNNTYTNLRWCTCKENCNNPLTIEKYKKRCGENHPQFGTHPSEKTLKLWSIQRRGKNTSPFYNMFFEHYGIKRYENEALYKKESDYYYQHKKCRWEVEEDNG